MHTKLEVDMQAKVDGPENVLQTILQSKHDQVFEILFSFKQKYVD